MPHESPTGRIPRILLVDDEPLNLRALHQILRDDYDLLMAKSGEEAVRVCEHSRPDLVLLDIVLPGKDGYATCRALRALPGMSATPVVFVSGHDSDADKARSAAAGGTGYLTKPVDPAQVRDCVRAQLAAVWPSAGS